MQEHEVCAVFELNVRTTYGFLLTQLKKMPKPYVLHFYATGRNPDGVYGDFSRKMSQARILAR